MDIVEMLRAEFVADSLVDEAVAEIKRLRTQCGGNCRYWEGRWRDEKADNARLRAENERLKEIEIKFDQFMSGAFV